MRGTWKTIIGIGLTLGVLFGAASCSPKNPPAGPTEKGGETPMETDQPEKKEIPSFTEEEKAKQKEEGQRILRELSEAAADLSLTSYTIPAGDYGFDVGTRNVNGVLSAVCIRDIHRPDDNPFTIVAEGVTFWFENLGKPCPSCVRSLQLLNCDNLKIVGLTLDSYEADDFEGVVTALEPERNSMVIRLNPNTMEPTEEALRLDPAGSECRIVMTKPSGDAIVPLYRVDESWGPGALFVSEIERVGEDSLRLTFRQDNLYRAVLSEKWKNTYGSAGTPEVGDSVVLIYGVQLFCLDNCRKITMERVSDYQAKGGFWEDGGYGDHLWKDCYFGPRPGTVRLFGGEGCMSQGLRHGSTYDGVRFSLNTDDAINIHGFWSGMTNSARNTASFDYISVSLEVGDLLEAYTKNGEYLGSLTVSRVPSKKQFTYNGTLTGSVTFTENIPEAMKAEGVRFRCPACECDGFVIRNCEFRNTYQRLLVQSGSGVIQHNVFVNFGSDISLAATPSYLEGGFLGEITVEDNVFRNCTVHPGGVVIHAENAPDWKIGKTLGKVTIRNNTFEGCGRIASASGLGELVITDNTVKNPLVYGQSPEQINDLLGPFERIGKMTRENNVLVQEKP